MFIIPMLRRYNCFINRQLYISKINKQNMGISYQPKYHKWANNYSFLYTEFRDINKNTIPDVIYL